MLAYNVETRQYYSVAPSQGYDEKDAEEQEGEFISEVQISNLSFFSLFEGLDFVNFL